MNYKVVITTPLPGEIHDDNPLTKEGIEFVEKACPYKDAEDELIQAGRDADALIIVGIQAYTRHVMESLPRCRHLCVIGIGYDGVDVAAATDLGILVSNNPFYGRDAVSDHAMALLLACARKLFPLCGAVREGRWDALGSSLIRELAVPMFQLRGQTLGLVGLGGIPRTMVPKAKAFGLRVLAYDPYVDPQVARELDVELISFDSLLQESDFVSIHAALTRENHKMFGREQFRKMKPTAYLINTARGGLVDLVGLVEALEKGWVAGAALDVTDPEPIDRESPLLRMPNVIITPHGAGYSVESEQHLYRWPLEEVVLVARGGFPRWLINPQVKEKYLQRWGS